MGSKASESVQLLVNMFQMTPLRLQDILIVCNKSDKTGAKSEAWLKREFAKQWKIALGTQHTMGQTDGDEETFDLPSLEAVKKELIWCETSLVNKSGLDLVRQF